MLSKIERGYFEIFDLEIDFSDQMILEISGKQHKYGSEVTS